MKRLISLLVFTLVISMLTPLAQLANANEAKESMVVEQVGTSGGMPAIKAQIKNGSSVGTYTLVLTNPNTGTVHSQVLDGSGKATTYVPNNFDGNGTYKYTLNVNGIPLVDGGVNLVSSKKTPSFVVVTNGTDLTIDVKGAGDYIGQMISFKSGSYTERLEVSSSSMQRAYEKVSGLGSTMTFTGPVGELVTVDVKNGEIKPISPPNTTPGTPKPNKPDNTGTTPNNNTGTTPSGNTSTTPADTTGSKPNTTTGGTSSNTGGSTTQTPVPNQDTGKVDSVTNLPTSEDKNAAAPSAEKTNARGEIYAISNEGNITKNMKLTLNKSNYDVEHTMVAKVEFFNKDYAGKSITIRLDADRESTVSLVTLDPTGKGTATFKFPVPQPSSKVIGATAYSIGGSQLDTVSLEYTVNNEIEGVGLDRDDTTARIDYMSLDLTELDKRKAVLAWYGAKNIHKYDTRLRVINHTTNDDHTYSVYIPDGESKINLNLVYDGPGIYSWELYVDGDILIQAPFSTPVEVDGTPTSQNGLPVLKTLANKVLQSAHLDGTDPNGVSGATIGEPIGGAVVADDFNQTDLDAQNAQQVEEEGGISVVLIILIVLILLVIVGAGIIIWKRKQSEQDQDAGFVRYEDEVEKVETKSDEDDDEFKEA